MLPVSLYTFGWCLSGLGSGLPFEVFPEFEQFCIAGFVRSRFGFARPQNRAGRHPFGLSRTLIPLPHRPSRAGCAAEDVPPSALSPLLPAALPTRGDRGIGSRGCPARRHDPSLERYLSVVRLSQRWLPPYRGGCSPLSVQHSPKPFFHSAFLAEPFSLPFFPPLNPRLSKPALSSGAPCQGSSMNA